MFVEKNEATEDDDSGRNNIKVNHNFEVSERVMLFYL